MCLPSARENPVCLDLKGLSSYHTGSGSWTLKTEHFPKALCQGSLTICALCAKKAEGHQGRKCQGDKVPQGGNNHVVDRG